MFALINVINGYITLIAVIVYVQLVAKNNIHFQILNNAFR